MCTFEESCNCNSDRLLMQAELHSAQILKPAKKKNYIIADQIYKLQPNKRKKCQTGTGVSPGATLGTVKPGKEVYSESCFVVCWDLHFQQS